MNQSLMPGRGMISLLQNVQTGTGAYPASYPVGKGGKAAQWVKLTADRHLVLRMRMYGAVSPHPHMLSVHIA
jgi:hypothetical protein